MAVGDTLFLDMMDVIHEKKLQDLFKGELWDQMDAMDKSLCTPERIPHHKRGYLSTR